MQAGSDLAWDLGSEGPLAQEGRPREREALSFKVAA
jgi:hypothetical protein